MVSITVKLVAAESLYKRDVFRSPDPFAVLTVDGYQTKSTAAAKKTLNPYWNETFKFSEIKENSVLTIQVFDQKKFKKKDQGFLGVVNIRISDVLGSVNDSHSSRTREETITRELKRSNDNLAVSGRRSWFYPGHPSLPRPLLVLVLVPLQLPLQHRIGGPQVLQLGPSNRHTPQDLRIITPLVFRHRIPVWMPVVALALRYPPSLLG